MAGVVLCLMSIKMLAASIDEFDPIPAIEHWNVAGVRRQQKENSTDENTVSDDNQVTLKMN